MSVQKQKKVSGPAFAASAPEAKKRAASDGQRMAIQVTCAFFWQVDPGKGTRDPDTTSKPRCQWTYRSQLVVAFLAAIAGPGTANEGNIKAKPKWDDTFKIILHNGTATLNQKSKL